MELPTRDTIAVSVRTLPTLGYQESRQCSVSPDIVEL